MSRETKVVTSVILEPKPMAALRGIAAQQRVSLAAVMRWAVDDYLDRYARGETVTGRPRREQVAV